MFRGVITTVEHGFGSAHHVTAAVVVQTQRQIFSLLFEFISTILTTMSLVAAAHRCPTLIIVVTVGHSFETIIENRSPGFFELFDERSNFNSSATSQFVCD